MRRKGNERRTKGSNPTDRITKYHYEYHQGIVQTFAIIVKNLGIFVNHITYNKTF
jgi:hypothetical protein